MINVAAMPQIRNTMASDELKKGLITVNDVALRKVTAGTVCADCQHIKLLDVEMTNGDTVRYKCCDAPVHSDNQKERYDYVEGIVYGDLRYCADLNKHGMCTAFKAKARHIQQH